MPIREVTERPRIPIKGIIRLGVREESRSGTAYPKSKEHFILDDAPEVQKYYGDDPKELDIGFPGNDINKVVPAWYKLWTPSLKRGNEIVQGRLLCQGDGPLDDKPGWAEWKDRDNLPKLNFPEEVLGERHPSGYLNRPCWGKKCVDAFDSKGAPKCKQTMQVFCIFPLISFGDVYQISTSSWGSIRSFYDLLSWHQTAFGPDYIVHNYYKITREEEATRYFDKKDQCEKNGKQYIMKLFHQDKEEFELRHSDRLKSRQAQIKACSMVRYLPTAEEASAMPMDEIFPLIEASTESSTVPTSEELLNDEDIKEAFARLEVLLDKDFTPKGRLISIRKTEGHPNPKELVLKELNDKIVKIVADMEALVQNVPADEPEVQVAAVVFESAPEAAAVGGATGVVITETEPAVEDEQQLI